MMKFLPLLFLCSSYSTTLSQVFWQHTNTIPGYEYFDLEVNDSNHVFVMVGETGFFKSTDFGQTWSLINWGEKNMNCVCFQINLDGTILAVLYSPDSSHNYYVFRSTDEGKSWEKANIGLEGQWIASIAINSGGEVFAASRTNIFHSTDNGNVWLKTGWDTTLTTSGTYISTIGINHNGTIFVGIYVSMFSAVAGIYRSTDNGQNWSKSRDGKLIESFAFDEMNNVFASGESNVILRSVDDGLTWAEFTPDSSANWINKLISNNRGSIFAAVDANVGVVRSTDHGVTWSKLNNGLSSCNITGLACDSLGYLYCSNGLDGVYRTSQSTITKVLDYEHYNSFLCVLEQNYPNPFNPITSIRYQLTKSSIVKIFLYDILGHEVSVLLNHREEAGLHEVKFDGSNLTSGVYFYKLQIENFTQTRKLLLIR